MQRGLCVCVWCCWTCICVCGCTSTWSTGRVQRVTGRVPGRVAIGFGARYTSLPTRLVRESAREVRGRARTCLGIKKSYTMSFPGAMDNRQRAAVLSYARIIRVPTLESPRTYFGLSPRCNHILLLQARQRSQCYTCFMLCSPPLQLQLYYAQLAL